MTAMRNVRNILVGEFNRELSRNKKGIISRILSKDILKVSSRPSLLVMG